MAKRAMTKTGAKTKVPSCRVQFDFRPAPAGEVLIEILAWIPEAEAIRVAAGILLAANVTVTGPDGRVFNRGKVVAS